MRCRFPSPDAKATEEIKVFSKLQSDYPGTEEGNIAEYYVGGVLVSQAKLEEARKKYQGVIDHGSKNVSSLAKYALAQIAFQENKEPRSRGPAEGPDGPSDGPGFRPIRPLSHWRTASRPRIRLKRAKLLEPLAKETGGLRGECHSNSKANFPNSGRWR